MESSKDQKNSGPPQLPEECQLHRGAPPPEDETQRLSFLRSLNILDTVSEASFDDITSMLTKIYNVPIALVSLVDDDRQWFKSVRGLSVTETPRDQSFCAHLLLPNSPEILLVPDAKEDPRFCNSPLVRGEPYIRFYCGAPIVIRGHRLGSLCMIDRVPKKNMGKSDGMLLANFADIVAGLIMKEQAQIQQYDMVKNPSFLIRIGAEEWPILYMNNEGKALLNYTGSTEPSFLNFFSLTATQVNSIVAEETCAMRCAFGHNTACTCILYPSTRHNLGKDFASTVTHPYVEQTTSGPLPSTVNNNADAGHLMFAVIKFPSSSSSPASGAPAPKPLWFPKPDKMLLVQTRCEFDSALEKPYCIIMYASRYCGACNRFTEFYSMVCHSTQGARFFLVSIDDNLDVSESLTSAVVTLPSVYFYKHGHVVDILAGNTCAQFRQRLANFMHDLTPSCVTPAGASSKPWLGGLGKLFGYFSPSSLFKKKTKTSTPITSVEGGMHDIATGEAAAPDAGGDSSMVDALTMRLQAERAHSHRLEALMGGSMTEELLSLRQNHEASLARIALLQRDLQTRRPGRHGGQGGKRGRGGSGGSGEQIASEIITEEEDPPLPGCAAAPVIGGRERLPPYRFAGTLLNFLMPVLSPCRVLIYGGPRADMLAADMQATGIDAERQRDTKSMSRRQISTQGRRGRPLAIVDVMESWSPNETQTWFSEVSDALPVSGIFVVVSTDLDLLDLLTYLAELWEWECRFQEGLKKDYWMVILQKTENSDEAMMEQNSVH